MNCCLLPFKKGAIFIGNMRNFEFRAFCEGVLQKLGEWILELGEWAWGRIELGEWILELGGWILELGDRILPSCPSALCSKPGWWGYAKREEFK